ncbi:DUF2189 domain-containing protein [Microvirga guangxiensis]|uniref:Uncharacterized membrane protein n=1 Tax=Microvirga guangxiensis TaxID=549386 RepID=A0A1G5GHY4_9HYPH|nr:DUF2189 domain-containing protein [Microvirga guangxiensis]SCY50967.1 Uncharacterized membrane protein [Microvirga guangxiensis]
MARLNAVSHLQRDPVSEHLTIRRIGVHDLMDALKQGAADFWAAPTHIFFICLMYPVLGVFFAGLAFGNNMLPLLFPLMSGFALIGPLAAVGLYEISRERERGQEVSVSSVSNVFRSHSLGSIAALGVLLMVIFIAWLLTAQTLYQSLFGWRAPESLGTFLSEVFTTQHGWTLIIVGNALGFVFSAVVFCLSVISFPLLVDRDVGAIPAILTSFRAVAANPGPMIVWAFIVAGLLAIGFIPLFIGLAIVLPILGHATWHLYRKVVE